MKVSRQLKTDLTGYSFIAPNLIGFIVFTAFPLIFSLIISFSEWDYTQGFSSIHFNMGKNYIDMWSDKWFTSALFNTIYFVLGTVPVIIVISLVLAVIIDKYVIGKTAMRLALFMPYISNVVAVSIVWVMMYTPYGPITQLIKALGVNNPPQWLGDYIWAMPAVMMVAVWGSIGYSVIIYSSAIQGLPHELYEAATIDGANGVQQFFKLTVPLLSPTTFFLMVTSLIASFQVFGQIYIMTKGGPGTSTNVLVYYIYTSAFTFFKMGYAASISWILFIIVLLITIVQWQGQKKWVNNL